MNWTVNGQNYPVIKLAILLGTGTGLTGAAIALLFQAETLKIIYVGVGAGLAGALAITTIFLVDITLSATVEGETRRAKLRAARRIYTAWAEGQLEPPAELKTASYRVNGETRRLDWLADDDPETARWRLLLVNLFQHARIVYRETRGERTGLTEVDLTGDTPSQMFYGRDAYLTAIGVAKDLGLVERINGVPTRLAEGWTFQKAVHYLQTAAVIPPIKERLPAYRQLPGGKV